MIKLHPDAVYAALAGVAVGGLTAPILFPMAAGFKTASLVSSIAASGCLAYGHESGAFSRSRQKYAITRESHHEIFIQQQASREALALRRIEVNELVETLVMLDELTPAEQRHFLNELGLPELFELYQPALPAVAVESQSALNIPVEVKVSEPEFAGNASWVASEINRAIAKAESKSTEADETFPEVDLGKSIAEMMVSGEVPLNVLLACPPRTGKTTVITASMAWLHKLTDGKATIHIRNGKENVDHKTGKLKDDFMGLAYNPKIYQAVQTPEEGGKFADFYGSFAATMAQPREFPDVLICDEFNNIRARANNWDSQNELKGAQSCLRQVDDNTDLLVTQGTSRRKFCLYSSHSSYVCHVGLDRSYQDGLYTIVLGRGAAMDALYKSLRGSMCIVRNVTLAKKLLGDLQKWENSADRDKSRVVVLTNLIDGNYGLYFAKYVDTSGLRFDGAAPAEGEAADPYEVWDEAYEGEFGNQPESDLPADKPSDIPNDSPLALLIVNLRSWITSLPQPPDDIELAAKLLELTGQRFNTDALVGIKGELGIG